MKQINLKTLEKRIWLSNFEDGFWDLYWGLLLLGFGVSPVLEELGVLKPFNFIIFPLLAFAVLFLGKKFITVPRMGMIKFGSKRISKQIKLFFIGIILFNISTIFFILVKKTYLGTSWKGLMSGIIAPIGYAVFFIICISVIAYFMEYSRLYFYAFLFGISIPLAEALYFAFGEPLDALVAFSITSMPILITGIILLYKFLQKYLMYEVEVTHVNNN